MKRIFSHYDWSLAAIFVLLSLFGIVMVYSSSFAFSILEYGTGTHFFLRQIVWVSIGFFMFLVLSQIPYQYYRKIAPILILVTFLLLILVLIPGIGVERNHSTRWISLGGFTFQPSELAKIVMILFFATVYTNKQKFIKQFKVGLLPPLLILAIVLIPILLQPDFGTVISITLACAGVLSVVGGRLSHLLGLAIGTIVVILLFAFKSEYRLKRITSFLDPFATQQSDGFQLVNSYIAIGDGGILGLGLGNGVQKLGYLPEAHTDFIMSIVVEELGVIGLFIVISLFLLLIFKGFSIYRKINNRMGQLLAFGITTQIATQAIMNLCAVSGLLPITGVPLPFISYGGTSLIITSCSLGILMNIARQVNKQELNKEDTIDLRKRPNVYMRHQI